MWTIVTWTTLVYVLVLVLISVYVNCLLLVKIFVLLLIHFYTWIHLLRLIHFPSVCLLYSATMKCQPLGDHALNLISLTVSPLRLKEPTTG